VSIAAIRQGLATNLATIPETQILRGVTSTPTPPTIWVSGVTIEHDRAMGSRVAGQKYTDQYTATVQALVSLTDDLGGQDTLDNYMAGSGAYSVKAAIEADKTLAGSCDALWVSTTEFLGLSTFLTISVLLAEWTVTIIATEVAI